MLIKTIRFFYQLFFRKVIKEQLNLKNSEAEAIVLGIYKTDSCINDQPQFKLLLQVLPDRGRNFITDTILLPDDKKIDAGLKVKVWYNPANNKVIKLIL